MRAPVCVLLVVKINLPPRIELFDLVIMSYDYRTEIGEYPMVNSNPIISLFQVWIGLKTNRSLMEKSIIQQKHSMLSKLEWTRLSSKRN